MTDSLFTQPQSKFSLVYTSTLSKYFNRIVKSCWQCYTKTLV